MCGSTHNVASVGDPVYTSDWFVVYIDFTATCSWSHGVMFMEQVSKNARQADVATSHFSIDNEQKGLSIGCLARVAPMSGSLKTPNEW
eukprot:4769659-Amphidinium_carterae.1